MNRIFAIFLIAISGSVWPWGRAYAQSTGKDSIYRFGDFLIHPTDTMKIDFIVKNEPHKVVESKGDTLYDDEKYLILGNADKLVYIDERYGIFRKYKLPYDFSKFKVGIFKGKLAPPNFKTDTKALAYRTQIKNQCKSEGVNFAGHFTVVYWGCGSSCMVIAIVDRITGRIFYSGLLSEPYSAFYGFKSNPDSKMIIFNNWMLEGFNGYLRCCGPGGGLEVAEWEGSKFKFLIE
jgi:hypothetical protein